MSFGIRYHDLGFETCIFAYWHRRPIIDFFLFKHEFPAWTSVITKAIQGTCLIPNSIWVEICRNEESVKYLLPFCPIICEYHGHVYLVSPTNWNRPKGPTLTHCYIHRFDTFHLDSVATFDIHYNPFQTQILKVTDFGHKFSTVTNCLSIHTPIMQSMRRVESEVSLTDMILANTKIPKSKSMVSLPQALASTIERFSCSQSQLACQHYLEANTQGFNDESGNHGLVVESSMRRGSSSSEMAIYDKNNPSSSSWRRTNWITKQRESERESHHTASTRESFSNDTYDSKTMKQERGQRTRKIHIRKIDSINGHSQGGPIPKWIYIEINQSNCSSSLTRQTTQDCSGVLLEQTHSKIIMQHADLIPLTELAMLMSEDLTGAIEKGLFYPHHRSKSDHDDQQVGENVGECDCQC